MNKMRQGQLNLLLLRQAYLVKKIQDGFHDLLNDLNTVQQEIQNWYIKDCEKIKLQAKCDEIMGSETTRIYHHELHAKQIKNSAILKLDTELGHLSGHDQCASYLENEVGKLLLHPAKLNKCAETALLKDVKTVFNHEDNKMFNKIPSRDEVKESLWTSNLNAAPGTDGLTNLVYKCCWDILGDSLVEVAQAIHNGSAPTLSQRT